MQKKSKGRKIHLSSDNTHLLIGAVTGGLLAVGLTLLLAPKKRVGLRKELYNSYQDWAEQAAGLGEYIPDSKHVFEKIQKIAKGSHLNIADNSLLVGGLAGGVLGAGITYLLTNQGHFPQIGDIASTTQCWIKKAKNVLDKIHEVDDEEDEDDEEEDEEKPGKVGTRLSDILELANVGFKAYQNFKKRK